MPIVALTFSRQSCFARGSPVRYGRRSRITEPLRFFEGSTKWSAWSSHHEEALSLTNDGPRADSADGTSHWSNRLRRRKPAQRRHWRIEQTDSDSFGHHVDAVGPVHVDEIGDRFRFKFDKGNLQSSSGSDRWRRQVAEPRRPCARWACASQLRRTIRKSPSRETRRSLRPSGRPAPDTRPSDIPAGLRC